MICIEVKICSKTEIGLSVASKTASPHSIARIIGRISVSNVLVGAVALTIVAIVLAIFVLSLSIAKSVGSV